MTYLYYLIPGIIFLAALITLIVLLVRKWPKLKTIDLEAMKSHQQKETKHSIVEKRIIRRLDESKSKWQDVFGPIFEKISELFKGFYLKIIRLEKKYKENTEQTKPKTQEEKELSRQKVNVLLEDAKNLRDKKEYHEAEGKCIEALGLDGKNIDVYSCLSDVYMNLKDYEHAQETLNFAKDLDPENDYIWRELGLLNRNLDDPKEAFKNFKTAVKISPKNPKNLDLLLQQSIINKERFEAKNTYKQLKEVNPDNNKLEEYLKQIEEL